MTDDLRLYRPLADGGPESPESVFGQAAADFWIIEGGRIPWQTHVDALDLLLGGKDQHLVIYYQPWWPGLAAKKRTFLSAFPGSREVGGSLLTLGVVRDVAPLDRVFAVRRSCGGANSGLWLLATTSGDPNTLAEAIGDKGPGGPPLRIALDFLDSIVAALALDEGAWSSLLVRRNHPLRNILVELVSALALESGHDH